MPSSPVCSAEAATPVSAVPAGGSPTQQTSGLQQDQSSCPAEMPERTHSSSSSSRPPYRRPTPPPPIITSDTPRTSRRAADINLLPQPRVQAAPPSGGESTYPLSAREDLPEPTAGVGPPTPMPVQESSAMSQRACAEVSGGETPYPLSARVPDAADLPKQTEPTPQAASEPLQAPESAGAQLEPVATTQDAEQVPRPNSAAPKPVTCPLSGRSIRPGSSSSRPSSRERSTTKKETASSRKASPAITEPVAPPLPHDRPQSRPSSRPSSRPPASRPGSRSENQSAPQGVPVALGADPLGAMAASRRQTPREGAPPKAAVLPPCQLPVRASSSADAPHRQRAHSSQPSARETQSAEPSLRRSGSVEIPKRHSTRHSSERSGTRSDPQSSPPPPSSGWTGAGDDLSSSLSFTMRRRAEKVAADQNANAKDREDSLLRMLDNRTRQRGVL